MFGRQKTKKHLPGAICSLAVVCFPILCVAGPTTGESPDALEAWALVQKGWRAERSAIQGYDVRFHNAVEFLTPPAGLNIPAGKQTFEVHLIVNGAKYFEESKIEFTSTRLPKTISVGFDGLNGWRRESDAHGAVRVGLLEAIRTRSSPGPLEFVDAAGPELIQQMISSGQFKLLTAKRADDMGKAVILVEIEAPQTGHRGTISYACSQGYLPIHMRDLYPSGAIATERTIDKVEEIKAADGNTCFYPIHGSATCYSSTTGKLANQETIQVDRASLSINGKIADDVCSLHLQEGERAFNAETGEGLDK